MNTTSRLNSATTLLNQHNNPIPAFIAGLIRFIHTAAARFVRRDDPAALRYAANKYNGEID